MFVRLVLSRLLLCCLATVILADSPATAGDWSWAWPVDASNHGLTSEFDAPDSPYASGHRGVDLAAVAGSSVRAVAAGVVSFAGTVAGVAVVSIDHGDERSTYQPVLSTVEAGARVEAGDVIGTVTTGPFHCATPCIHLGRIANSDDAYLDPSERLATSSPIRLVDPEGPPPVPPIGATGSGLLRRPVGGPVTSRFGPRTHPITGKESDHDGVDFGAACGTAVHAAGAGRVISRGRSGAYGQRVVVRHAHGLETSYSHLSSVSVDVDDVVTTGTVVGRVGSSGLSTGCHLHFGVRDGGKPVDPLGLL